MLVIASQWSLASEQPSYRFDLRSQPLSSALIQFSHQSGLAIVFPDPDTRGIDSAPLEGRYTAAEAMDHLLAESSLAWRLIDDRIIAVFDADCRLTNSCQSDDRLLVEHPLYVPGIEELYVYGSSVTGSRIARSMSATAE